MNAEQAKRYELDGKQLTLREWCKEYGVPVQRTRARLNHGWTLREALATPQQRYGKAIQNEERRANENRQ